MRKKYTSDLSDSGWKVIQKFIRYQRKSKWSHRHILDGIFYIQKNGSVWRDLPVDFPPWQTVYWYFRQWQRQGLWELISQTLVLEERRKQGCSSNPTAGCIDSQSVKNSSSCTQEVGIDGGKLIKGRKRFLITDTQGLILTAKVYSANQYDGSAGWQLWQQAQKDNDLLWHIKQLWADATFAGTFKRELKKQWGVEVIIQKSLKNKGFQLLPRRWVIERTLAWLTNDRRLARDYERLTQSAEAFILIGQIRRLLNRLII